MAERTIAPSPFDQDSDSDVILASSDNVVFYSHKMLLALVSPVFKTMFTLPVGQSNDVYDGRPCIALAEDSDLLYLLLSWCDQRCTTRCTTVSELERVLEVADKYGMEAIMKHVQKFMENIETTNPIELFAISARFRLGNLAQVAAKKSLNEPLSGLISMAGVPATRHLNAYSLRTLLQYHMNCSQEASRTATDIDWLEQYRELTEVSPFTVKGCGELGCEAGLQKKGSNGFRWLKWWLAYMEMAAEALTSHPSADTITSSKFLEKVHAKISAISCHRCRKIGQGSILAFNNFLANEVRRRIEKVNSSRCSDDRG